MSITLVWNLSWLTFMSFFDSSTAFLQLFLAMHSSTLPFYWKRCRYQTASSNFRRVNHGNNNQALLFSWRNQHYPANIHLDEDVLKISWGRLSSLSSEDLFKTSLRCLGQGEYIRLGHTSSKDVLKTSSRCFDQDEYICLCHTSSRHLQEFFKTTSRCLQDVLQKHLQEIFNTSSRRFEDVFKTSSRHLQDFFKTCHQVKLFLLTQRYLL